MLWRLAFFAALFTTSTGYAGENAGIALERVSEDYYFINFLQIEDSSQYILFSEWQNPNGICEGMEIEIRKKGGSMTPLDRSPIVIGKYFIPSRQKVECPDIRNGGYVSADAEISEKDAMLAFDTFSKLLASRIDNSAIKIDKELGVKWMSFGSVSQGFRLIRIGCESSCQFIELRIADHDDWVDSSNFLAISISKEGEITAVKEVEGPQ